MWYSKINYIEDTSAIGAGNNNLYRDWILYIKQQTLKNTDISKNYHAARYCTLIIKSN